ncbi:MAG: two-component system response regulator [Syntrophus sp. (in: bacteria)]|nr:two-component system response regulator [Syntrophus sp. (in: bacteria)]
MTKLVAVIDDEPDILELVSLNLQKAGFKVKGFLEADSFLRSLSVDIPDLIILDLMLPDTDGFEICKHLKSHNKHSAIPIIMLTARIEETDKVLGLELGADDYVTKPFSPRELVARVKAVLRRNTSHQETKKILVGDVMIIDLEKYEVIVEGKKIELTATEFKILQLLCSRRGWVHSRDQILNFLWGQDKTVIDRTIDVHIRHLRNKLGKASELIKNVRGMGYKIEE